MGQQETKGRPLGLGGQRKACHGRRQKQEKRKKSHSGGQDNHRWCELLETYFGDPQVRRRGEEGSKALCGQVCRQTGGVTQNGKAVRAGDTEAISVGEDAAPEPRVYGADSGQEEEAPIQVVMGRLVNRDSARAPEPLHRGWEFRAAEGAVQDDPIRGPERPSGTGGHCTRIKKVWRVDQPHSNTFPTPQANQAGGSWTEAPQCK